MQTTTRHYLPETATATSPSPAVSRLWRHRLRLVALVVPWLLVAAMAIGIAVHRSRLNRKIADYLWDQEIAATSARYTWPTAATTFQNLGTVHRNSEGVLVAYPHPLATVAYTDQTIVLGIHWADTVGRDATLPLVQGLDAIVAVLCANLMPDWPEAPQTLDANMCELSRYYYGPFIIDTFPPDDRSALLVRFTKRPPPF